MTERIRTEFVYPPIPIRNFDWQAVYDDYDGAEDSHCPIGHGRTEADAVLDLIDNAPRYPDCCERWPAPLADLIDAVPEGSTKAVLREIFGEARR
jgi:hypothetical protein